MRRLTNSVVLACLLELLLASSTLAALNIVGAKCSTTNVATVTTAETIAITSDALSVAHPGACLFVQGWAQVTTGANTTTVTPKLHRGTATTGTTIGEANTITIGAAAGSNETFSDWAVDCQTTDISSAQYNFSLTAAGADANGSILNSCIRVEVLQ